MEIDVGKNIKNRRKQLRLSQARLSELSGISQSAISDIENPSATKRPNTDTIQKLALALNCSVSDLMGESKNTLIDELLPDEKYLIDGYRKLSTQGQEYIRQQMFMAVSIYKKRIDLPSVEGSEIN